MLGLVKLIKIRVQALDFLGLEPATIGHRPILPLNKELMIASPPGGHELIIKDGFDLITGLNSGWCRKGRRIEQRINCMARVQSEVSHVKDGTVGHIKW
jgi:hypothetical protein